MFCHVGVAGTACTCFQPCSTSEHAWIPFPSQDLNSSRFPACACSDHTAAAPRPKLRLALSCCSAAAALTPTQASSTTARLPQQWRTAAVAKYGRSAECRCTSAAVGWACSSQPSCLGSKQSCTPAQCRISCAALSIRLGSTAAGARKSNRPGRHLLS